MISIESVLEDLKKDYPEAYLLGKTFMKIETSAVRVDKKEKNEEK